MYCMSFISAEHILFANGMLLLFVCLGAFPFLLWLLLYRDGELRPMGLWDFGPDCGFMVLCTTSTASNWGLPSSARSSTVFLPLSVRHPSLLQRGCVMLWSGTVNRISQKGSKREKTVKPALEMQVAYHVNSQQENRYCRVPGAASSEMVIPLQA